MSNPDINQIELADVPVPTMIMHARDGSGPPYPAAVAMARRIPSARVVTVDRGGHLMLGMHRPATVEVEAFLEEFLQGQSFPNVAVAA